MSEVVTKYSKLIAPLALAASIRALEAMTVEEAKEIADAPRVRGRPNQKQELIHNKVRELLGIAQKGKLMSPERKAALAAEAAAKKNAGKVVRFVVPEGAKPGDVVEVNLGAAVSTAVTETTDTDEATESDDTDNVADSVESTETTAV